MSFVATEPCWHIFYVNSWNHCRAYFLRFIYTFLSVPMFHLNLSHVKNQIYMPYAIYTLFYILKGYAFIESIYLQMYVSWVHNCFWLYRNRNGVIDLVLCCFWSIINLCRDIFFFRFSLFCFICTTSKSDCCWLLLSLLIYIDNIVVKRYAMKTC